MSIASKGAVLVVCAIVFVTGSSARAVRISVDIAPGATAADSGHAHAGLRAGMASEGFDDVSPQGPSASTLWVVRSSVSSMGPKLTLSARLLGVADGKLVGRESVLCAPEALEDSARAVGVRLARRAPPE